jgi:hypothetical protein
MVRGVFLTMGLLGLAASGCGNHADACNARIPPNVQLTLVDATTQGPVRGFAQVDDGAYDGYDDCYDCGGCSTVNVLVVGKQTVRVTADGYAPVTLELDGGTGSGVCGYTFQVVRDDAGFHRSDWASPAPRRRLGEALAVALGGSDET